MNLNLFEMARTKASVGSKVSSFKSSKARCSAAPAVSNSSGSTSSDRQSKSSSGGNPVCPRETPKWQKPITNFFICKDGRTNDCMEAGTSNAKTPETESINGNINSESDNQNNVSDIDIQNNDLRTHNGNNDLVVNNDLDINNDPEIEIPKNRVLDESIELHPLNGENSHKMDEYFNKGHKGKGVGKKTKGGDYRRDNKRSREDYVESVSKKVKVDE